jgi:2,4'-dihydroxyacetophenone dioxygenase
MFYEHIHTTVVDDASIPWIPFAPHNPAVLVKYLKADPVRGETITLMKAPAGAVLPRHQYSGRATVYTIEGRWKYQEYDWLAAPGSIVCASSASSHTVEVMGHELLTLNIVVGDVIFLGDDDEPLAIENWKTSVQRYEAYCKAALIVPHDITSFS